MGQCGGADAGHILPCQSGTFESPCFPSSREVRGECSRLCHVFDLIENLVQIASFLHLKFVTPSDASTSGISSSFLLPTQVVSPSSGPAAGALTVAGRPHKCTLCGKRFRLRQYLSEHLKRHLAREYTALQSMDLTQSKFLDMAAKQLEIMEKVRRERILEATQIEGATLENLGVHPSDSPAKVIL